MRTRDLIIKLLSEQPMSVRRLVRTVGLGSSSIRYHLKNIPNIKSRQLGTKLQYWI